MRQADKLAIFRILPPKLSITLVAISVLYIFLQPVVNQKFGWTLPSAASILELDFSPDKREVGTKNESRSNDILEEKAESNSRNRKTKTSSSSSSPDSAKSTSGKPSKESTAAPNVTGLAYEILKPTGRDRFISPAGLIYGPGSEEGHRLKHIERHLEDQPNRPGSHGVFEGDMPEFLKAIDDAYSRAKRGEKGTTQKTEDNATVYEATFPSKLGFLGGVEGKRRKNPQLKRMRVVVSANNSVITAFPF